MDCILFDLDGTLTRSGEGIMNSVEYALDRLGIRETDREKLRAFIGPPLVDSFMKYYGFDHDKAALAVEFYRERFRTKGIFENELYPGIENMLASLQAAGFILAIASSKPEVYVRQIAGHFRIGQYFSAMTGSTLEGKRLRKADVIEEALTRLGRRHAREHVIMVGDKEHDILGARQAGLSCIAVRYGYGSQAELAEADPYDTADSVEALRDKLLKLRCPG